MKIYPYEIIRINIIKKLNNYIFSLIFKFNDDIIKNCHKNFSLQLIFKILFQCLIVTLILPNGFSCEPVYSLRNLNCTEASNCNIIVLKMNICNCSKNPMKAS